MRSVIVGGGVAGISAAMDVARRGLGEVIVLSDETYPYYYRPQLTEFLAGNLSLERLIRRPLSWYQERGIDVRLGTRAARLLPDAKSVVLQGGDEIGDHIPCSVGLSGNDPNSRVTGGQSAQCRRLAAGGRTEHEQSTLCLGAVDGRLLTLLGWQVDEAETSDAVARKGCSLQHGRKRLAPRPTGRRRLTPSLRHEHDVRP